MAEEVEDRDLEPKYVIVYVSDLPLAATRIARTHARSFETKEELLTFVADMNLNNDSLRGAWVLSETVPLQRTEVEVTETKTVHQWS